MFFPSSLPSLSGSEPLSFLTTVLYSTEESLKDGAQLKQLLLKALTLMLDAAESYAKDSCVRQALHCNRLTKLITLQIHFLNSGQNTMLINLGHQKLMDCIMTLPRFYQVRILGQVLPACLLILWCFTLGPRG